MRQVIFKKVDKLVAISVLGAVLLAWGFLVGLDAFKIFLGEINDVGTGDYTLTKALVFTLLTVPRRAYQWFGYAALIGGLLGMGMLATSGELTALRAAGLSKFRICMSVILSLIVLTGLTMLMGETIAPRGESDFVPAPRSALSRRRDSCVTRGKARATVANCAAVLRRPGLR